MPVQAVVLAEDRPGGLREGELRSELPVGGVAGRIENRERVGAAGEEHGDEHRLGGSGRGARDAFLQAPNTEPRRAVDGERDTRRADDEGAPVESRSGGKWHAGFDRRQPAAGLCRASPHQARARELGAVVAGTGHQQVWKSGEMATSWRSAFSISVGYSDLFQFSSA